MFVILIAIYIFNRIQNEHFNMSEQTSQKKNRNTKPNSAKPGINISKEVPGIILI